jgi:hypothetical protein
VSRSRAIEFVKLIGERAFGHDPAGVVVVRAFVEVNG